MARAAVFFRNANSLIHGAGRMFAGNAKRLSHGTGRRFAVNGTNTRNYTRI